MVSTSIDVILCSSKSSSNESIDCCEMIFGVVELGEKESESPVFNSFVIVTGLDGQIIKFSGISMACVDSYS